MFAALISTAILIGISKIKDRRKLQKGLDPAIEWWVTLVLVLSPSMLIDFLSEMMGLEELPKFLNFALYPLYFIVPFLTLKFILEFKYKPAFINSVWIVIIAVPVEFVTYFIFDR